MKVVKTLFRYSLPDFASAFFYSFTTPIRVPLTTTRSAQTKLDSSATVSVDFVYEESNDLMPSNSLAHLYIQPNFHLGASTYHQTQRKQFLQFLHFTQTRFLLPNSIQNRKNNSEYDGGGRDAFQQLKRIKNG